MVCSQGTGKCRCCCHPDAAGKGLLFSASFPHRAIQEILLTSSEGLCPGALRERGRFDSDLQLAMELSAKEPEDCELRLRGEEEELQQILQPSGMEKYTFLLTGGTKQGFWATRGCCITRALGLKQINKS